MEDVEQRRQRLAAMREQAALQCGNEIISSTIPTSAPTLANPLDTSSPAAPAAEGRDSGFDFYTDPLAGFSSFKRRRPGSAGVSMPSSTPHPNSRAGSDPPPCSYVPRAPMWQPVPYQPAAPLLPSFDQPQPPPQFSPEPSQHLRNQSYGRGRDMSFPGRGGFSPGTAGRRAYLGSSAGGRGLPSSVGGGRGYTGGRGNLPFGSSWVTDNGSIRTGSQGRRQRGDRTVSAREQPHLFFRKSMVEDPWRHLEASRVDRT